MKEIPHTTGTYALILEIPTPSVLKIGQIGEMNFDPGIYAYVGSALGAGGLHSRIVRHFNPQKVCHWHIDYLTIQFQPCFVIYRSTKDRLECAWCEQLLSMGASTPQLRFGNTDCNQGCPAHLFRLPPKITLTAIAENFNGVLT